MQYCIVISVIILLILIDLYY